MALTNLNITHEETSLTLRKLLDFNANNRKGNLQNLINFLEGVRNGSKGNVTVDARMGETAATATITSTGIATAAETLVVNGVTITATAGTGSPPVPAANEFIVSSTVATQATNIASAINNSSTAGVADVTATSALGVVTLTCDIPGTIGNAMTLSESVTNVTVSGANFASGASDEDVTWTA